MTKALKSKIQYVSYSKESIDLFTCTSLSSPEAFNDYDINIIDFSDPYIWRNKESNKQSLNNIKDIENVSQMIKVVQSKVLIILPQNIDFKYYWSSTRSGLDYIKNEELKNMIPFLNNFIETILSQKFDNKWLMYNKTKSKIFDEECSSDFVFKQISENQIVTRSEISKLPTTINYTGKYFTTLKLKSDSGLILKYIQLLGWFKTEESAPKWLIEEKFFNDDELIKKQENLKTQIQKLSEQLEANQSQITVNNFYKSCLYKTGDELVEVINTILDEMIGYDYTNFIDQKRQDFLIEKEDIVFIGEIKGINTNIKNSNISQTATHRDLYKEIEGNENKNVVALSIITRQRSLPISQRSEVHSDVIRLAKMNNVLIITTETLLKIFENLKLKKTTSEDIKKIFINSKGIINENDIAIVKE